MEPSIRKAGSGKTVRVATTFTGAAACAFAFAPTALAGTPQQAAQPGHQGRQVRVNTHAIPYIETGNCRGAGQSHWFHMGSENNVTCFGFRGTDYFSPVPILITSFCGGNTHGFIVGDLGHRYDFGPGTTYRNIGIFEVSVVHISSTTGTDKCPLLP